MSDRPSWGGARVHVTTRIDANDCTDLYETPFGWLTVWKVDGASRDGVKAKAGTSIMVHRTDAPPPATIKLKRKYYRS